MTDLEDERKKDSGPIEPKENQLGDKNEPSTEIEKGQVEGPLPEERAGEGGEDEGLEEVEAKKWIIIVDSHEKILDEAIKALRKGEYRVTGVESTDEFFTVTKEDVKRDEADGKAITPDEFWALQKGNIPDLVITDLDLKDLDGWEFVFRLKFDNRFYEYREVPIILRTDEPITIETVRKVQAESIHDYLPKSVKGKELLHKIDLYFEMREKLAEKKLEAVKLAGYRVANEYERISLALRIRLKYLHALKARLEAMKGSGADPGEIKTLEEVYYIQRRELIKYERRRHEIKKRLKVKKDERTDIGREDDNKVEAE